MAVVSVVACANAEHSTAITRIIVVFMIAIYVQSAAVSMIFSTSFSGIATRISPITYGPIS